jgi:hypothetical protein
VRLLTGCLFDRKKHNRIRLIIHPGNQASRRVAEKRATPSSRCRAAPGSIVAVTHDVEVWALLSADHYGS